MNVAGVFLGLWMFGVTMQLASIASSLRELVKARL